MTFEKKKSDLIIWAETKKEKIGPITAQFNPEQYSISKSNQFATIEIPGRESPIIQFIKGQAQTLSIELFFDTYAFDGQKDVREVYVNKILDLQKIDQELHAPPVCTIDWGGDPNFKGIIESIDTKYTMFNKQGHPIRATLSLKLKQFTEFTDRRHSSDRTKRKIIRSGDSLWHISYQEYGDAKHWKKIAYANNIQNPRELEPGMELVIPPLK